MSPSRAVGGLITNARRRAVVRFVAAIALLSVISLSGLTAAAHAATAAASDPPRASFAGTPTDAALQIAFDAGTSSDADGTIPPITGTSATARFHDD